MKTQEKTIILHTYPDISEAQIMQEKLRENGIPSFLNDENVLGLDPVGGVELRIFEYDRDVAEMLITGNLISS